MRRFVTVPAVLLCAALAFAGIAQFAPEWIRANGLDFWNVQDVQTQLRDITEQTRELEYRDVTERQRDSIATNIAASLCDGYLTLNEALSALHQLARNSPEWITKMRLSYRDTQDLPVTASDGEVLSCFLLIKIKALCIAAEVAGDVSRADFLATRLTSFEEELPLPTTLSQQIASTR